MLQSVSIFRIFASDNGYAGVSLADAVGETRVYPCKAVR